MTKDPKAIKELKRKFWDDRAPLGKIAGTNDFNVSGMETEHILNLVKPGSKILEVGSGNGLLLTDLVRKNKCTGLGIDFSPKMVEESNKLAKKLKCSNRVTFIQGDLLAIPKDIGTFDYVITKRALCNLANGKEHHEAFTQIMSHVKPGGFYLMLEDFIGPLNNINTVRKSLKLYEIEAPWHNVFLNEKAVLKWQDKKNVVEKVDPFISTYYFLSRVLYAKLAADNKEPLRYDSPINLLATKLPVLGDYSPTKLIVWRRRS
jgi:ubiquinone/menaquinone biosynthesis C-methylase UbiE